MVCRILRHSNWDALLIVLSVLPPVALWLIPSIPLIAIGVWWNSNTVSHNFIHTPFFRTTALNRGYSLYLSDKQNKSEARWHTEQSTGLPSDRQNNCAGSSSPESVARRTLRFAFPRQVLKRPQESESKIPPSLTAGGEHTIGRS
jgi:hypothetical protein